MLVLVPLTDMRDTNGRVVGYPLTNMRDTSSWEAASIIWKPQLCYRGWKQSMPTLDLSVISDLLNWTKRKALLIANANNTKNRLVKRGQVYKCDFGYGIGSEMSKARPCVVVQNAVANIHSPNTIVAPITHSQAQYPTIVPIIVKNAAGSILVDGVVNLSGVICVSKSRLGEHICELSHSDLALIDAALARALDLMRHYNNVESQLRDKLNYIERIKADRNYAQDQLTELMKLANVTTYRELINKLKTIDNCTAT